AVRDDVVRHRDELVVAHVDLALAGRCDLVVVRVERQPEVVDEDATRLVAEVLEAVDRRSGVVALLEPDGEVRAAALAPRRLARDDLVARAGPWVPRGVRAREEPDPVEHEELNLRAPVRGVVSLLPGELGGPLGHVPRIAGEALVAPALVHVD